MARKRIYTSLDEKTDDRLRKFNKEHPERPIKLSAVLKAALDEILTKEGY